MRNYFFCFIFGFAGGVAFRSFFDFGETFPVFLLLLGGALLFVFVVTALRGRGRTLVFLYTGIVFIAAGAGIVRFYYSENPARARALDAFLGKTILLEGKVADEPDIRAGHTKLAIHTGLITLGNETMPLETKLLIITEHYPEFSYGDTVRVRGKAAKPITNIKNEDGGGRTFNYKAYLAKDGIYYEMFYPRIERLAQGGGNPVKRALFSLKRAYLKKLGALLPEPHASLAGGITVGAKEALGDELLGIFRATGIIHIVVLSGYNITIIARVIERALAFLPRMTGIGFSAASVILFAVMTGAGATVVRASLMALLALLARATGRVSEITAALFAAALLMLLANPHILVFDPSFQLSFLATAGLLFLAPAAERFFRFLPVYFGIREAASATFATQIFVLPALVYMMGEFSIVSFAVNILVLPLIPLSMLFSFLTAAVGFLHLFLAAPFSYVAWALLAYELAVTKFFAAFPFASIKGINLSFAVVCVVYVSLVGALIWYTKAPLSANVDKGAMR